MEAIQNSKSRLIWLDLLKGFCMIMIVLSHTPNQAAIYSKLYSPIFLSAFFFASGYTFKPRENFKSYFVSKIKSLAIPFICLGMINALLAVVIEGDAITDRLKYLISIRSNWDDLWFIACLFTMQFIFYAIYMISNTIGKKTKINGCLIILSISFILSIVTHAVVSATDIRLPLQLENACACTFSMAIGYAYKANEATVEKVKIFSRGGVFLGLIYLIMCILIPNDVGVHGVYYQSLVLYHIESIIGLAALISLCRFLGKHNGKKLLVPFIFIGQNTLVYYAFQSKGIKVFELIFNRMGLTLNTYLMPLLTTVLVCICLSVPAYIISRWFPFLLGKKYRKQ